MATAYLTCPESNPHARWKLPARSIRRLTLPRCGPRLTLASVLGSLGTGAYADLPLTLEEVIAKKDEVTVELGFDYGNFYNSDFSQEVNQDALSLSFGMRYGLASTTEIYGSLRGAVNQARDTAPRGGDRGHTSGRQWDSLTIGLNHRFSSDNKSPALLGYLQTEALENPSHTKNNRPIHFRTWSAGIITYRRLDPVVFSLSSGFRYNAERNMGGVENVAPWGVIYVSPKINLALNAETSVSWGARWSHKSGKRVGGETQEINVTQTSLLLGTAYAVSKRVTLHFDLSADISGRGGSNVGMLLRYTFG